MKLFTVGPVEMYEEQMNIGGQQVPYFRNQEFSNIVFDCQNGIKKLVNANDEDDVILLTASGTAAMEATVMNCFTKDDCLIVINGGTFGQRFEDICQIHEIPYTAIRLDDSEELTEEHFSALDGSQFTGLLVNMDETSTGQLYDIKMISDFCKKNNLYLVVDAISAMFSDPFDFSDCHMDIAIVSSQKALSLAPGLSIVIISKRMIENRVNKINSHSLYLDFKIHLLNGKRGQTPFTPAVRLIIELQNRIHQLLDIGIENQVNNTALIAKDFREKLIKIGLHYPTYPLSNACTVVLFPDLNADVVGQRLKDEYGYIINPNGGDKAKKQFRVAHIGNHTIEDNDLLIDAINKIMKKI